MQLKAKLANMITLFVARFNLPALSLDFVECLSRYVPTDAETRALRDAESAVLLEGSSLCPEDHFMLLFGRVKRLKQRLEILCLLGNFTDMFTQFSPVHASSIYLLAFLCNASSCVNDQRNQTLRCNS